MAQLIGMQVPLVGQPIAVFDVEVLWVMVCKCQPEKPLLGKGLMQPVRCEVCGKHYGVAQFHFDRNAGRCDVQVATLLNAPPSAPQPAMSEN